MKKRAIILEFSWFHGEVIPSLVYLLNRLDFSVDVYVSPDLLELNPFVGLSHLDFNLMPIDRDSFDMAVWKDTLSAFDVLVLNTFKRDETLAKFAEIEMPTLLVVHNGHRLSESESNRDYVSPRHREVLVLSPHVAAFLKKNDVDSTWVFPGMFASNGDKSMEDDSALRTFCVQGKTRIQRRNYWSIITAVGKLKKKGFRNFSVKILGKSTSVEGYLIQWIVFFRGLGRYFSFFRSFSFSRSLVGYDEFYRELRASTFLCPLIDKEHPRYRSYFVDKASSSIPAAIGNRIIPIVHEDLASIYGISSCAITYRDGMLSEALQTALELSSSDISDRQSELSNIKTQLMTQSEENLKAALNKVMGQARSSSTA